MSTELTVKFSRFYSQLAVASHLALWYNQGDNSWLTRCVIKLSGNYGLDVVSIGRSNDFKPCRNDLRQFLNVGDDSN